MALTLITPASEPVVSLAQAKAWCRVEGNKDNELIAELVLAAQRHVEQLLGQSLGEQGWRLTLDSFSDAIELARGPVTAVTAFRYFDANGDEHTVDPALYSLDLAAAQGWIVRNDGEDWPELLDGINAVTIEFTAGYGPDLCPPDLAHAIKVATAHMYDTRDAAVPWAKIADLMQPHRRILI